MKFEIKSRWTGSVIFTAEIEATDETPLGIKLGLAVKKAVEVNANLDGASLDGANLDGASLDGANLVRASLVRASLDGASLYGASLDGANLYGASLDGANLDGASLVRANLDGASLDGANLDGANLWIAAGNNRHVRTIQAGEYLVSYTNDIMQIGCQRHAIADWWEFDDRRIAEMDGKTALSFWKVWKPLLQQIIAAAPAEPTGYVAPEKQPEAAE